jgi:putative sigma-54 modulation protein
VRNRTRLAKGLRQDAFRDLPFEDEEDEDEGPRIVRVKQFSVKPMSEEEAMLQLELLGHAFYVFRNVDTNEINVLYKRKDGNFGLIEPL